MGAKPFAASRAFSAAASSGNTSFVRPPRGLRVNQAKVLPPMSSIVTIGIVDFLLDERARELMWEGHRRTDLIRYGYYTAASFPWTLKGGIADGKIAIPEYMTIYPIIMTDMNANSKLVQNIETGEVWVRVGKNRWQCRNCGAIIEAEQAPEKCPVCDHPKAYFQLEQDNF